MWCSRIITSAANLSASRSSTTSFLASRVAYALARWSLPMALPYSRSVPMRLASKSSANLCAPPPCVLSSSRLPVALTKTARERQPDRDALARWQCSLRDARPPFGGELRGDGVEVLAEVGEEGGDVAVEVGVGAGDTLPIGIGAAIRELGGDDRNAQSVGV